MAHKFKKGDKVRVVSSTYSWAGVKKGDIGEVKHYDGSDVVVKFKAFSDWHGKEKDFVFAGSGEDKVAAAVKYFLSKTPQVKEVTEKPWEEKALALADDIGGCCKTEVKSIIKGIAKELAPAPKKKASGDLKVEVGTVVVPTGNPNSHNYAIGKPCMVIDPCDPSAIKMSGDDGNFLPEGEGRDTVDGAYVRYATPAEIETFARSKAVMQFLSL